MEREQYLKIAQVKMGSCLKSIVRYDSLGDSKEKLLFRPILEAAITDLERFIVSEPVLASKVQKWKPYSAVLACKERLAIIDPAKNLASHIRQAVIIEAEVEAKAKRNDPAKLAGWQEDYFDGVVNDGVSDDNSLTRVALSTLPEAHKISSIVIEIKYREDLLKQQDVGKMASKLRRAAEHLLSLASRIESTGASRLTDERRQILMIQIRLLKQQLGVGGVGSSGTAEGSQEIRDGASRAFGRSR